MPTRTAKLPRNTQGVDPIGTISTPPRARHGAERGGVLEARQARVCDKISSTGGLARSRPVLSHPLLACGCGCEAGLGSRMYPYIEAY